MTNVLMTLDWHASSVSSPGKVASSTAHRLSASDRRKAVVATKTDFQPPPTPPTTPTFISSLHLMRYTRLPLKFRDYLEQVGNGAKGYGEMYDKASSRIWVGLRSDGDKMLVTLLGTAFIANFLAAIDRF